jgi:hypothetical protein
MTDRTTESEITFTHPFQLSAFLRPMAAGTYRVTTDEDLIQGLSYLAYKRSATMLHIPAIGAASNTRQYVRVDPTELEAAQLKDHDPT